MKKFEKTASNQDRFKALRIAEIKATDQEDFQACVADMQRTASLSKNEAEIVANAIRAKYLPTLAKEAGFTEEALNKFVNLGDSHETADFAKDTHIDEENDMSEDDTEEFDGDDDSMEMDDDASEVEDDNIATFEIEVPADMVDAAQKAVQEALDKVLGGQDSDDEEVHFNDDEMDDESDDEMEDDSEEQKMHTASRGEKVMNRQSLAARRAEREEILKRFASEEEHVEVSASFTHSEELNQYPGEMAYPKMKLQGENSMKNENPVFEKTKVPTMNPGNLQLADSMDVIKLDGGVDSGEVLVKWDKLDGTVPSNGEADLEMFEVPTEMDLPANKTTRAAGKKCECCDATAERLAEKKTKIHSVTCDDCKTAMAVCGKCVDADASCPHCTRKAEKKDNEKTVEAAEVPTSPTGDINVTDLTTTGDAVKTLDTVGKALVDGVETIKASVDSARIKAAYSCSTKLALAGIINSNEVDQYADQMLNDNLRADAMIRQTQLLLRSAQTSAERLASAAAEKLNVRTASSMGISTSPALSGSANSAALDIQSALKGTWTMPKIED
jgi:hypothetical protein